MKTSEFLPNWVLIVVLAVILVPGSAFGLYPCNVSSMETNCIDDGSVALLAPTNSPAICLGDSVTVTAGVTNINSYYWIVTHYDNGCSDDVTDGGDAPLYGVTWTASAGSWSTNGTGLTATFTPTNCGAGTVRFDLTYTNVSPCGEIGSSTNGGSFTVDCDCLVSSYTTNNQEGKVTFTNAVVTPTNACLGNPFNASVNYLISNAIVRITTHYTNSCGSVNTNYCPDTFVTNNPAPTIVSNFWTIGGPGAYTNAGIGLSTGSFTPTNGGSGTVTFTIVWQHACDTNTEPITTNVTFFVSTNCFQSSTETNCVASGSVALINPTMNPTNGWVNSSFSASVTQLKYNSVIKTTTRYTNACGETVTYCPEIYSTNTSSAPTIISNWWVASVGTWSTNDYGLTASFSPTNAGSGTVTFYTKYANSSPCDTSEHTAASPAISFTVVDMASVVFQTDISALFSNPGSGGGKAIYPDKPAPGNTDDNAAVKVVATVTPTLPNIMVYFKAIDVDDPSSTSAPLDDETSGTDNRGTSSDGSFTVAVLTDTNGVASTKFHVSMQPGDNFRVVASGDANFRNQCQALQNNDHGAVVFLNTTTEIPSNYRTEMLTVWRRLHVEVDSMSAVISNRVIGTVTGIRGNGSGATNVILSVNLKTGLTPNDTSPNLSSATPANGRFENGWITIGNSTSTGLLGNGDNFVQMPGSGTFNIPFTLVDANGSNAISGQVKDMFYSLNSYIFNLNTTFPTNLYAGGTLTVAGTALSVMQNSTNGVRTHLGNIPFTLHDDDDDSLLPAMVFTTDVAGRFAQVYVAPEYDGGGNLANNQTDVPFVPNTESSSAYLWQSRPNNAPEFWVCYLLMAYQDSYKSLVADFDPNSEGGSWASANNGPIGSGVLIYGESMRDGGMNSDWRARVCVHEIGHTFGLPDRYVNPATDGIMHGWAPAGTASASYFFIDQDADTLRRVQKPN